MTRNFRLPSLDLASAFEDAPGELAVPGALDAGENPALAVLAGGYVPPTSVCRFVQPEGLAGIQLGGTLPAVLRLRLVVRTDWLADTKWTERAQRLLKARAVRGIATEGAVPEIERRHRLVEIRVQGRRRALVLLRREDDRESWARYRMAVDVATEELDGSGLLLLSFGPADLGAGVAGGLPEPLVGVDVRRIRVELADGPLPGHVSTGSDTDGDWAPYDPQTGFAVVNAPDDQSPVRVEVTRAAAATGRLAGRLARSRVPALAVDVTDAAGTAVTVADLSRNQSGTVSFTVPAGAAPAIVRITGQDGADATDVVLRALGGA
ncbi:MAG: hypothetical protein JWR52_2694 [Marmoricola sp.]|nr:hypothetical protein [Marmoricola sp.]